MFYDIRPVAKPRMTSRDKWRKTHKVYWAFKEECQLKMRSVNLDGASIMFYLPMPKSWSKKKRAEMLWEPHRQKPDLDNLIKALGDALYGDDSHISALRAGKCWTDSEGGIWIQEGDCHDYGGWVTGDNKLGVALKR